MNLNTNDPRFRAESDSQTIQNAVDEAERTGLGTVVIPRRNERTGENIWIIDKTIWLPSDTTVILDGAHLQLADDVRENVFRNSDLKRESGRCFETEQHDIRILGVGNAIIDGGKSNGLCEQLGRDDPEHFPHMSVNLLIYLNNVRDFEIRGIRFIASRWWAVCCMFCRWGRIADLDFRMFGTIENQDGVDLRVGCEYITIENITGCTGDDTVALTGLPANRRFEMRDRVEGKSVDIHDITIRNIISSTHGCSLVRLLCADGCSEYNLTISGLKDTGMSISGSAMLVGAAGRFWKIAPHTMENFHDIIIRDVFTNSQRGISFSEPMKNVLVENVTTWGCNEVGLQFNDNFACENMTIRNFTYGADPEHADCVFNVSDAPEVSISDLEVEHVRANAAKYVFRRRELPVEDFRYAEPTEEYFSPEKPRLGSSYGRYHSLFYGKLIENRPPDNRYDGTSIHEVR